MAVEKSVGFILDTRQVRESSQEVTFYTKEFGKFRGLLKGSRISRAKYLSPVLPASLNAIIFYIKRKEPHLVTQCDLVRGYEGIRLDMKKTAYAAYFLELTGEMNFPHDVNKRIFNLLLQTFEYLEVNAEVEKIARVFEIRLIKDSGLMPRLSGCVFCGDRANLKYFSPACGGVLCVRCLNKARYAFPVSAGALKSIEKLGELSFDNLKRLKLIPSVLRELSNLFEKFLEIHVEKRLNSLKFIEKARI
ncbi:MAG: DNA repair protein RecO [Candidatus Omnitrophica bacterium]|nr:DNA repair protein RecO [Candidatus Omnitrophota bacterium]